MAAAAGWRQEAKGTALAPRAFTRSAAALLWLNLLDGLFTMLFLQLGVAEEANPVMRWAYEESPLTFMGLKLASVQLGLWLLCRHPGFWTARAALHLGALLYAGLVAYHLSWLFRLFIG
jgi:hypothetical protein